MSEVNQRPEGRPRRVSRSSATAPAPEQPTMSNGTCLVLVLLGLSLVIDGFFEMRSIQSNNQLLETRLEQQQETYTQARRVRAQLQEIAGETARLADQGNPNAKAIRRRFEAQGVQLRASSG